MPNLHPDIDKKLQEFGIHWSGPELIRGPLPAFFYFALTGHESLHLEPYCQPALFLKDAPIRCYSLNLPFHTEGADPKTSMMLWAEAVRNGEDFLAPFLTGCIQAGDTLISLGLVDPAHLFTGGLSRGGFVALHLAAQDPRFRGVLGFAPMTKLPKLAEFKDLDYLQPARLIDKLVNTAVRFYIGNRDERVGTDSAFEFIQSLTELKYQNGERSPQSEIFITRSVGHKGHGTLPETFRSGTEWIREQS